MHAQPGFNKVYLLDSCCAESFESLVVDNDTIVVMRTGYDISVGSWGVNLLKIDTFGNILESGFLSDSIVNYIRDSGGNYLVKTPDGGYAFSVTVLNDTACPHPCINLAKFNHNLELEFNRHYSAPEPSAYFSANKILALENGSGFFLLGNYLDETADLNSFRAALIRADNVGEIQWIREYGLVDTAYLINNILEINNNTFLVSGGKAKYGNVVYGEPFDMVLDSLGESVHTWWSPANTGNDKSVAVPNGGYIQIGTNVIYLSNGSGKTKPYIRRVDSVFTEKWKRYVDVPFIPGGCLYRDLQITPDSNYIAVGDIPGYWGDNSHTGMSTKITDSGEVLWERFDRGRYGSFTGIMNQLKSVGVLSSGSIVACGSTWIEEPVAFSEKSWLIKLSPGGCMDDTDTLDCWAGATVVDVKKPPPSHTIQVYPNPAQDYVTFEGAIQGDIIITDLLGREVKRLRMNGLSPAEWRPGEVARGLYVWRQVVDGFVLDVGKIVVE